LTPEQSAERPVLPNHIEETLRAMVRLRARHDESASVPHRVAETIIRVMTRPLFVSALAALVGGWVLLNLGLKAAGLTPLDPPPFAWLNDAVSLLSLFVVIVVLSTQRRDEELAQLHQQLTLQLALLGEQKTAKLIALVEALRRDHPAIPDRIDAEAQAMAQPANPEAVLDALNAKP
jgi:uncharacterized membrane protein